MSLSGEESHPDSQAKNIKDLIISSLLPYSAPAASETGCKAAPGQNTDRQEGAKSRNGAGRA